MRSMRNETFAIRPAGESDAALLLSLIRELAVCEKLDDQITANEEDIRVSLFEKKQAEAIIGEANGRQSAFALFFHNYSTFLGKANLYLEDLFVKEEFRGRGVGKAMLRYLAAIDVERGCERLDWLCLDRNRSTGGFSGSAATGFSLL